MEEGKLLWEPPDDLLERSAMAELMRDRGAASYDELWRWSVDELEEFWAALWDRFGVDSAYDRVLADASMPGAVWFPGAQINYAEHMFRGKPDDRVAIVHASELRDVAEWTWGELREQTGRIRAGLVARGVGPGDRVAAYMPNLPETVAAFLATASLGAVWSSAAPEFGIRSVCDRFAQIEVGAAGDEELHRVGGVRRDADAQVDAERVVVAAVDGRVDPRVDGVGLEVQQQRRGPVGGDARRRRRRSPRAPGAASERERSDGRGRMFATSIRRRARRGAAVIPSCSRAPGGRCTRGRGGCRAAAARCACGRGSCSAARRGAARPCSDSGVLSRRSSLRMRLRLRRPRSIRRLSRAQVAQQARADAAVHLAVGSRRRSPRGGVRRGGGDSASS